MKTSANFWQRKLIAFLHDPPHKALDIPGHEEAAQTFFRQAGATSAEEASGRGDREADHLAAAADRLPLFSRALQSPFGGTDHPFKHPLGGSELPLKEFPSPDLLAEYLQSTQPAENMLPETFQGAERARINFFLHWRRWPVEVAREPAEKNEERWRSAYLPADTRLPDHSIWLHNSVTSALAACEGQPAFLIFQLGPVQDFIAQARSTRDLWSGSYLLSWLIAHAIKAVTDEIGPDAVIFPFLRAQPLFDLLHRDEIYSRIPLKDVTGQTLWDRMKQHENEMLVPNLPNKFLALIPAPRGSELAEKAAAAVADELKRIADACWDWIHARHALKSEWRARFDGQIQAFPQITWQVYPWPDRAPTDEEVKRLFGCEVKDLAYPASPGLLWAQHYQTADALHAARRNTRGFDPWMPDDPHRAGASKDVLSGKEEIIGSAEEWWEKMPRSGELARLFRDGDKLGAINMVKRVWHRAYLDERWGLKPGKTVRFESVPDIAAAEWVAVARVKVNESLKHSLQSFEKVLRLCETLRAHGETFQIRVSPDSPTEQNIDEWIEQTAPEAFLASEWKTSDRRCDAAIRALNDFYELPGVGKPPGYVAVIAMDGDDMGKWISGELAPPLADQLSKEARKELAQKVAGRRRPLSPSYHLQFSEALANFALYLVRPIVEHFHGQVIYAGGDDVLAMTPAARALECAAALRQAFRGQGLLEGVYKALGSHGGFVKLAAPKGEQPTWPLIVPGPRADMSAGIAIGHCHSPLQNLVEAARRAEKLAKRDRDNGGYGKSAFAVSLFKRSGEVLEWGAKWDSKALEVIQSVDTLSCDGVLSGRFPYALTALLRPYAQGSWKIEKAEDFNPFEVFRLEFEHVARQQGKWPGGADGRRKFEEFVALAMSYLGGNGGPAENTCSGRRLDDFLGPFLTHAFISRQGAE